MKPAGIITISLGKGIKELSTVMNRKTRRGPYVTPKRTISSRNGIR
jgi:hypothetical protein